MWETYYSLAESVFCASLYLWLVHATVSHGRVEMAATTTIVEIRP
jgi:hypothetical protein